MTIQTQTAFIFSVTDFNLTSQHTDIDSYMGIRLSIISVSSTKLGIILTSKYQMRLEKLGLNLFIFNPSEFLAQKIKIEQDFINFTSLPTGIGAQRLNYYDASYVPSTINSFYYGVSGFEFGQYLKVGF